MVSAIRHGRLPSCREIAWVGMAIDTRAPRADAARRRDRDATVAAAKVN